MSVPDVAEKYSMEYIRDAKRVPLCEDCMAVIRPKVLLFGEQVDNRMMTAAAEEIAKGGMYCCFLVPRLARGFASGM